MNGLKAHIISQLQQEILHLQGFKTPSVDLHLQVNLGPINAAFPNSVFPVGAVHEFISAREEDISASCGFISGIAKALMQSHGVLVWIGAKRNLFPPALEQFGINPQHVIFIDVKKDKEILWVMEEALHCAGLSAVVAEIPEISFTSSRRLQLAVEQSRVTGFLLRKNSRQVNTTACVTRWQISSSPSETPASLPGVGYPTWNVDLVKVRNGKPGRWIVKWIDHRFQFDYPIASLIPEQRRKTG